MTTRKPKGRSRAANVRPGVPANRPKILTSPAKGAKRTAEQWSAAFRAVSSRSRSTVPRSLCGALAGYCVREGTDGKWGIYLRDFNVRVATLASNSHPLQQVLARTFDSALAMKQKGLAR